MSIVDRSRTRARCDARECAPRTTYVDCRPDPEDTLRRRLGEKGWALVKIGDETRSLCPEHAEQAEALLRTKFVQRPPEWAHPMDFSNLVGAMFGQPS